MNRLAHWMMRLYPKRWRARYGDELDALLSDTGADTRVVTDLFRGGIRMQFKTWSFLKLVITLGLVGLLIGTVIAWMLPVEYTSVATLQITPAATGSVPISSLNDLVQQMETGLMSRTSLSRIIHDPALRLYPDLINKTPLDNVIDDMKRSIFIAFVALPGTRGKRVTAFDIKFTYPDPVLAQKTVNALIGVFREQMLQREEAASTGARAGEPLTAEVLDVLDNASLPNTPSWPNKRVIAGLGFFGGVFLAGVIWLFRRRLHPEPEYPANVLHG